ncbi:MAG: hypothetical protein M3P29_00425 [Acidobacteriota bacterium]|nr:hypothetical protein [Acidobacteriota bacterium]
MAETIDGATYRRHAFLLGFLNKAEVDALFSQFPLRLPAGVVLATAHQQARVAKAALVTFDPGATQPLPATLAGAAEEVRGRAVYKKEYEAKGDYEFVSVPIDSLLTPQMNVDMDYVSELAATLPAAADESADFAFAFPSGQIAEPFVRGNTAVFTSHAPNIAISPVPVLRRTGEGFDIVFEAKSRPNFMMVARVAGRLVLHNGVHKALALKTRGRTRAYVVAHELQHQDQLGLPQGNFSMFSETNYSQGARPPLVADFNSAAAVSVLMRATINIYRLAAQTEDILAPVLSTPTV